MSRRTPAALRIAGLAYAEAKRKPVSKEVEGGDQHSRLPSELHPWGWQASANVRTRAHKHTSYTHRRKPLH